MVKSVGFIEIITAVAAAFDAELTQQFPPDGRYISTAKWSDPPTSFTSYRPMAPFLTEIETRLKRKFGQAAAGLDLNLGNSTLKKLYAQPMQQTVIYVAALLMAALAESGDAKIL